MKVLIIDDEIIIRNGMVQVIPWSDHDYEILKPAASAEEALIRIKEEKPDIIISDIRMKGMSGLELVNQIAHYSYSKEVILLTGYDEFKYVQEAIKQNVSDYLLKTSSPEEILRSVNKARGRLEETRKYIRLKESAVEQVINDDIKRILQNTLDMKSFEQFMKKVPELTGAAYQIFVINTIVEKKHYYQAKKLWNTYIVGRWLIYNGQTLIITKRNANLSDEYLLQMAAKKIKEIYKEPLFVSNVITTLIDLPLAYEQAISLFLYKWLLPGHILIGKDDIKNRQGIPYQERYEEHENELLNCIRSGDEKLLKKWVEDFVSWIYRHPMATPKSIEGYIQNLYFNVTRYIDQISGLNQKLTNQLHPFPPSKEWFIDPVKSLTKFFIKLLIGFERIHRGSDMYVSDALFYMDKYLGDSITLQDVAKYVHIHPNYLGELIRKETSKSYLELLTDMRIKRAGDYLVNTTAKVKEISNLVGYSDPKYFTSIFKKHLGVTPSEYRSVDRKTT